jgi:ferredoxin
MKYWEEDMSDWKKLTLSDLNKFLEELSSGFELWIPEKAKQKWIWDIYDKTDEVQFPPNIINESVKALFFPKRRPIAEFDLKKKWSVKQVEINTTPRVIMGLRSCDVEGIDYMDRVFLHSGYTDEIYKGERERTLIIGMICDEMGEHCHCTDRMSSPDKTEGMDIIFKRVPDGFLFRQITEKGSDIMNSGLLIDTDEIYEAPVWPSGRFEVAAPEDVLDTYDDEFWNDASDICLTCGGCTFSCPTCLCFLVADEKFKGKGERVTVWDTCQFSAYSRMAGGHNPRDNNAARVRNRTLDKFGYSERKYGRTSCTGCGRCVIICPLKRSFPYIARNLTERIKEKKAGSQGA